MILADENILPFTGPRTQHSSWIAEAIWGHRIESQPASALLLEFLSMAEGMHRQGKLLQHDAGYVKYVPYLSTQLRNLLFNNPRMEEIGQEASSDEEAWTTWLKEMKDAAVAKQDSLRDFTYLRERFETFRSLTDVVVMLRNITMDQASTRGWTYTLLFPIGPAAFYDEVAVKRDNSGFERGHTLFTRTGEIAYLMLSRSSASLREPIATYLERMFDTQAPKNLLLCRLMSDNAPDEGEEKSGTYLPYKTHPAYDRMAEDVLALFRLNLPGTDTFAHLGPLLAFHLLLYQFETANAVLGRGSLPTLICEVLAPRSNIVRRASVGSHDDNEALGTEALKEYTDGILSLDSELAEALDDAELDDLSRCDIFKERVKKLFHFKNALTGNTLEDARSDFRRQAMKAYHGAGGEAVRSLARQCGLSSRFKTTRYRYAPSDHFLRNMVYVTVSKPVKESDFLAALFDRYQLVIGPAEAAAAVREEVFDQSEFSKNCERLLQRLMAMGLARRMSDSFTYIINPIVDGNAS